MTPGPRHAAAQALPEPGHVIAGKYAIVKVLGEGGMGVVFEATHLRLRQRVALKMLLPEMLEHPVIRTRFEREARAAGQLRSRHAARVMDVDVTADGLPYMVMEFLEGHDLQTELERRGQLPYEEVVDAILQACAAMIEAHQLGIVHRDLKPANLFLAIEGGAGEGTGTRIVKVLDFGISKLQEEGDASITEAESVIGTAMYMSPEQLRSSVHVDARTDIWALGVLLYELLAGRPPWVGTSTQVAAAIVTTDPPDLRAFVLVPAELAAIIVKALKRDPAERFADVRQLALALAPFAPAGSAGRAVADGLVGSASNLLAPRPSLPPPLTGEGLTLVRAAAISQPGGPAPPGEVRGVRGEGTAPGWSQHSGPQARGRTFVIGALAAFVIGLVIVGGLAAVWMRWGGARRVETASAQSATSSARGAPSPSESAAQAQGGAPASPSASVAVTPATGDTAPVAGPVPAASAASKPRPAAHATGTISSATAPPGATAKGPATGGAAKPHPPAAAAENPLTL